MNFEDYFRSHVGKKVVVCGIGVSNLPLIRLLRDRGISTEARDKKTREDLGDVALELEEIGVKLVLGEGYLDNLNADIIYRSPGMMPHIPEFVAATDKGALLTSEMEAFFEVCPCRTIGITGSDGKTTTSTLIAKILEQDGKRAWLGGNIGTPLLDKVHEMSEDDYAVVELSSFQLMTMHRSPEVAVITNIAPNHLDMHKDMDEYVEAKRNIMKYMDGGRTVLSLDNALTRCFAEDAKGDAWGFTRSGAGGFTGSFVYLEDDTVYVSCSGKTEAILHRSDIMIPGIHNVENYMTAIAALYGTVRNGCFAEVARTFGGVEHRIELVRIFNDVKYYNDSIASSPTRTNAGLNAFEQKVILIAGGYDKNIPFEPLAEQVPEHVKLLILMGATKDKIKLAIEMNGKYNSPIYEAVSLEEAVMLAKVNAVPGDVVLFSPACASFDMFPNFAVRGNAFKDIVKSL